MTDWGLLRYGPTYSARDLLVLGARVVIGPIAASAQVRWEPSRPGR